MFELTPEQVEELLRRAAAGTLTEEDREIVCSRLRTWCRVLELLSQEGTTIDDLRELLLGTRGPAAAAGQDGPRYKRASRRCRKVAARRRRRRTR